MFYKGRNPLQGFRNNAHRILSLIADAYRFHQEAKQEPAVISTLDFAGIVPAGFSNDPS